MSFWESVETYQVSPSVPWADESEYFSPLKCCGRWGIEEENNFLCPQQRVPGMLGVHSRSPKSYPCILMALYVSRHHLAVMLDHCVVIVLHYRALCFDPHNWITEGRVWNRSLVCDQPNLLWTRAISEQRHRAGSKLWLFSIHTLC